MKKENEPKQKTVVCCKTCVWYSPVADAELDPGDQWGSCRRFPPQPTNKYLECTYEEEMKMKVSEKRCFPPVWCDDHCGEYLNGDGYSLLAQLRSRIEGRPTT